MQKPPLKITFLGTGTSQGVPVIGCECEVCQSKDLRDQRLRTSALVSQGKINIAIDCGPDFRQQMLRAGVKNLHAILLTHQHNDHVIGLDEVRAFNFRQRQNMPVYGTSEVLEEIKKRFEYIFVKNPYPGSPMLELIPVRKDQPLKIGEVEIIPIEVMHGTLPVLGYRVGDFTYLTDVKTISPNEITKVAHSKVLAINALHHEPHHSHLNLKEALELLKKLAPEQAYLTHMSHRMGLHSTIDPSLPPGIGLAYDGLVVEI